MGEVIELASGTAAPAERPLDRPRRLPPNEPLWRKAVGRELREERLSQGRTLRDVAEDAGVSVPYLSEVERGIKEPSSEVLDAVRGALGLRLVDLTYRVTRTLADVPARAIGPTGPLALAT